MRSRVALLVGIDTREHEDFESLKYTEKDVEELAELLREPPAGFAVRILTVSRGKKDPEDLPTAKNILVAVVCEVSGR